MTQGCDILIATSGRLIDFNSLYLKMGSSAYEYIHATHTIVATTKENKLQQLVDFVRNEGAHKQIVIFTRSKARVDQVYTTLRHAAGRNFFAFIHGDVPQWQCEQTLKDFRPGRVNTLIATVVLKAGLNYGRVDWVLQFDLPYYETAKQ